MIIYPTKTELIKALQCARLEVQSYEHLDPENPTLDVRLQCTETGWELHTGDAQYDTDHSGVWGADSVRPDMIIGDLVDVASYLLLECRDMEDAA